MKEQFRHGSWYVEYSPEDGARLHRLCFDGYDLLTTEPNTFRPPVTDYGKYETRPVYGYDDCFPTVDSCTFPGRDWTVPDHGELCWLKWQVAELKDGLTFFVKSKMLPLTFKRVMRFIDNAVIWNFTVTNNVEQTLPFQHIMHPLMPLTEIVHFDLPSFKKVFDEIQHIKINLTEPEDVREYLLNQPWGTANMFLLNGVKIGRMKLKFKSGLTLKISFSEKLFPTIGIWWNNSGYPDETGCRRNECAFEPIPGTTSVLSEAYDTNSCLFINPKEQLNWQMRWEIEHL